MASGSFRIVSEDLNKLRRDLRDLEDDGLDRRRQVLDAFRDAAEIVTDEAKLRANAFSFRVADAIEPGASMGRTGPMAFVKGRYRFIPWGPWGDFGSRNPRTGQPRSVGPWTRSGRGPRGGRFIYPAIEAKSDAVVHQIETGVDRALRTYEF